MKKLLLTQAEYKRRLVSKTSFNSFPKELIMNWAFAISDGMDAYGNMKSIMNNIDPDLTGDVQFRVDASLKDKLDDLPLMWNIKYV